MSLLIKDEAQFVRANRANSFGMHPEIARRYRERGIDPEALAQQIRVQAHGRGADQPVRGGVVRLGDRSAFSATGAAARLARMPGRAMEFNYDPSDETIVALLNQAAYTWKNPQLIGTEVCPLQVEDLRSGQYYTFDRTSRRQAIDDKVGTEAPPKRVSRTFSPGQYAVIDRALEGSVNRLAAAVNPKLANMAAETEFTMDVLMLQQEIRISSLLHNTGAYPGANVRALGAGYQWNGGGSANPVTDILYCMEQILAPVTDLVFSDLTWHAAQENAQLRAIVASRLLSNEGLLTPMDLSLFFGIPNMWVSKVVYEDAAGVHRVWNENDVWMGVVNAVRDELTFARVFRFKQGAGGMIVRPYFDPKQGMHGGDVVVVGHSSTEVTVAQDFGCVITGARQ